MREIGLKKVEELRGFPILRMGIMEDVFQMEGKVEDVTKINARARSCFGMG